MASAPKIKAEPAAEFRAKANLTELKFWNTVIRASSKPTSFADIFVLMADPIIHS